MNYLTSILIIGLLIFIHELGHLVAARWMGIEVARFSLGFGPVLWSRCWRNTEYCLSSVPLGGYVLVACENEADFYRISAGRRIVMWLGGPVANFLLAAMLLAASNALAGDLSLYALVVKPWLQVARGSLELLAILPSIFLHPQSLSGIVGIVAAGKSFVSSGLVDALRFAILLNLNLAIFNLLPIAPLDGGKIVLCALEKVVPRMANLQRGLTLVGLAALLLLMAYTTVLDVIRQFA